MTACGSDTTILCHMQLVGSKLRASPTPKGGDCPRAQLLGAALGCVCPSVIKETVFMLDSHRLRGIRMDLRSVNISLSLRLKASPLGRLLSGRRTRLCPWLRRGRWARRAETTLDGKQA